MSYLISVISKDKDNKFISIYMSNEKPDSLDTAFYNIVDEISGDLEPLSYEVIESNKVLTQLI